MTGPAQLNEREHRAIALLASGGVEKQAHQIGMKRRQLRYCIDRAKAKTGAKTTAHLIALWAAARANGGAPE